MQKPRPAQDAQFVFHPESDAAYRHFENHQAALFQPDAGPVTRATAWWLADAALLAYWDAAEAIARFKAAGFTAEIVEGGETQAYVAFSDRVVLVAFRGTEPDRLGDVFDDARLALVKWSHGFVHAGFRESLERVWPAIAALLGQLAGSRRVWFCGHSLGAALATLAADRFSDTAGACTLGSPRVGNRSFAAVFDDRFGSRVLRYVNDTDIVTHVPLPPLYAHVGELRQITPEGRITGQIPALSQVVHDVFGGMGHLREVTDAMAAGRMRNAPDWLLDHMPRGYAVDIWNDFDAHGEHPERLPPRRDR